MVEEPKGTKVTYTSSESLFRVDIRLRCEGDVDCQYIQAKMPTGSSQYEVTPLYLLVSSNLTRAEDCANPIVVRTRG